jgi:hypothetical protein
MGRQHTDQLVYKTLKKAAKNYSNFKCCALSANREARKTSLAKNAKASGMFQRPSSSISKSIDWSMNRQRQTWNIEILIHARDLAEILSGTVSTCINLAGASRRIVAPVPIGH